MTGIGLGLPNRALLPWEDNDIDACHVDDFLDLWIDGQRWPDRWGWLVRVGSLHVRIGVWGELNATADAELLTRLARQYPEIRTLRCRNEPNIEADGATPDSWRRYLMELMAQLPDDVWPKVFVPAISPGGSWKPWLDNSVAAARDAGYVGIDCHAYGTPTDVANVIYHHRERWSGRLMVTEYNLGAGNVFSHEDWAAEIPDVLAIAERYQVETVLLFIWQWANPNPPPATSVDVKGGPVEAWLRNRNPVTTGGTMATPTGYDKAVPLIGAFRELEIYHQNDNDLKTSMAIGERGYMTWRARTNETIVVCDSGEVYADGGNFSTLPGQPLRRIR